MASIAASSDVPAAAAASSGSKGSPATAAPSSTRRAGSDSGVSSSVSAAATADGTPMANDSSAARKPGPRPGRAPARAAGDRTGCRRSLRRARPPRSLQRLRRGRSRASAGVNAPSSIRVSAASRCARSSAPRQSLRRLARPHRQSHQHRRGRGSAQQRAQQLDRCRVGPVDVVEHEHQWRRRREPLEELADGAMAPVALVLGRHLTAVSERPKRREDVRELRCDLVVEYRQPFGSRPPRYSSSASTKTENGRSCSNSDAAPKRTRCPRTSARAASSSESRVLPIPGSPATSIAPGRPRSSSSRIRSSEPSSSALPIKRPRIQRHTLLLAALR